MSSILCCTATDRLCCYWASCHRRTLLNIELGLQICSFILYTTALILATSTTPSVIDMGYFVRYNLYGFSNWQRKYNSNYSASLRAMTWMMNDTEFNVQTAFDSHPDRRYDNMVDFDIGLHDDGMARVTASLAEFKFWQQADIDAGSGRPHQKLAYLFGVRLQDAPWSYDLAVDEFGNACDRNVYIYSYDWAYEGVDQGVECNTVYDRDGSQGHIHSYGQYNGNNVTISVMLAEQDNTFKARFCSPPTQEIATVIDLSCPICEPYQGDDYVAVLDPDGLTDEPFTDDQRNRSAIALGREPQLKGVDYMTCGEKQYERNHYLSFRPIHYARIESCARTQKSARPEELGGTGGLNKCCVLQARSPSSPPAPPTPPDPPMSPKDVGPETVPEEGQPQEGVCYRLTEIGLMDPPSSANMMIKCLPASNRVEHLIVSMLVLSIIRIAVGLIYLQRWSAKADVGKKGINIWCCIIPIVASIVPILDYQSSCVIDPPGYEGKMEVESGPGLTLLAANPVVWMGCLVIEIVIPAGKYAIREAAPPPGVLTEVQVVPHMKNMKSSTRPSEVDVASAPWMDVAATKVQSMFRGRNTRKVVVAQKSEENAATKVQAMFRGRSVRSASSKTRAGASAGASGAGPSSDGVDAESGTLQIHLQRARGLISADRNGLSDPYAKLSLAGQSHTSKTIRNTLNPDWDEVIQFEGSLGAMVTEGLSLQVFDWDFGSRDDKLGEATVDLTPLRTERQVACTTKLPEPGKGEVQLHLSWAPAGETHPPAPQLVDDSAALSEQLKPAPIAAQDEEPPSDDPLLEKGILRVTLCNAVGLLAADENGKSDPYVKMHLAGQIFKSKVKKKTLAPHWDETFDFKIERGLMASQQLKLAVYDFDTGSLDDKIGAADIDITVLTNDSRKSMEVKLSPVKKKGVIGGVKGAAAKAVPTTARRMSVSDGGAGTVYLRLRWVGQQSEAMKWLSNQLQSMGDVGGQVLTAAARFLVDPLGAEANNEGEGSDQPEWAKRQYYVIIWDGPRAGECSTETYSLGRLKKTFEDGAIPAKVKVWPADSSGWRRIGQEIETHCGVAVSSPASRAEAVVRDAGSKVATTGSKVATEGSKVATQSSSILLQAQNSLSSLSARSTTSTNV